MRFDADLAEIRFGYGRAPAIAAPRHIQSMLQGLTGPDVAAQRFPIEGFDQFRKRIKSVRDANQTRRKSSDKAVANAAGETRDRLVRKARGDSARWAMQTLLRAATSQTAFRERLVSFWADHFTAQGRVGVVRQATSPYVDDAIRPHIAGRFSDLLEAALTHPLMLHYLDQDRSIGPRSKQGIKAAGRKGLNENLAREALELHTLGVDGPYSQTDVRQLAELFTGMTFDIRDGFRFRPNWAEPGEETVLGTTYSGRAGLAPIRAVLEDLALHPATARHLATKLAVHFVSDTPNPDLVAHMAQQYLASDGALMALYQALLEHDASWAPQLTNIKPPIDFLASSIRALDVDVAALGRAKPKDIGQGILRPLTMMGQPWQRSPGPDGWTEDDSHWLTPQGLAGRTEWAMRFPVRLRPELPDPRAFVHHALGAYADESVQFAASAAESRSEAIGLVLLSPAFQRR